MLPLSLHVNIVRADVFPCLLSTVSSSTDDSNQSQIYLGHRSLKMMPRCKHDALGRAEGFSPMGPWRRAGLHNSQIDAPLDLSLCDHFEQDAALA